MLNPNSTFGKATTAISAKSNKRDPKFWLDRVKRIGAYQDLVKIFLSTASKKQAKSYNLGRKDVGFKVGDQVMRRDHPLSNAAKYFSASLAKKFSGPYKIKKVISPNVYELELPAKSKQNPKAHFRFLKPYVSFTVAMSDDYPKYRRGCWNCGGNHDQSSCPVWPKKVYCYTCGWPGKTVRTCPRPECRKKYNDARIIGARPEKDGSGLSSPANFPPLPPNILDPNLEFVIKRTPTSTAAIPHHLPLSHPLLQILPHYRTRQRTPPRTTPKAPGSHLRVLLALHHRLFDVTHQHTLTLHPSSRFMQGLLVHKQTPSLPQRTLKALPVK